MPLRLLGRVATISVAGCGISGLGCGIISGVGWDIISGAGGVPVRLISEEDLAHGGSFFVPLTSKELSTAPEEVLSSLLYLQKLNPPTL